MKSVLLLDDDKDLCSVLSEIIRDIGSPVCTCVFSLEDLKKTDNLNLYDLALLDVNLGDGAPSGIDAYNWLMEKGFKGKVAFFTGHARSHPLVKKALEIPSVTLIEKPAEMSQIEALII
jgi:DNA-binding NtrC family response regulator